MIPATEEPAAAEAEDPRPRHHLGWQITGVCNRRCPYCLRLREDKPVSELDAAACARILDSYLDFVRRNGFAGSIMYSGGNPMLRRDLPRLLARTGEARAEGLIEHISILANPETIDEATAHHLGQCRVDSVSISLDGRPEHNDRMRGPGSHAAAVAAIPRLVAAGVRVSVKYTLTRWNIDDVPYVYDLARTLGAVSVGIGIMREPDGAGDLGDLRVAPADYRRHLLGLVHYDDLADDGQRRFAGSAQRFQRGGLNALLYHELGRYDEYRRRFAAMAAEDGPGLPGARRRRDGRRGRGMFVVWEDGSVHASNGEAHPILGMVPQESFQAIHERRIAEGREFAALHRRRSERTAAPPPVACAACPVRSHCPGEDPLCWRLAAAGRPPSDLGWRS